MENKNIKIAFFDAKPYDIKSFDLENKAFNYKIEYFNYRLNKETAITAKGYEIVCAFVNDIISEEVINILYENGTKLLALRCAGFNNLDFKATLNKIHVVRVPDYSPYAIAEHAAALMLSLNRKVHKAYYRTRDNNFNIDGFLGFDMHAKTAGIIGTGKIGKVLIKILKGFGMEVLAYDAFQNIEAEKELGFKYVDLDTLYKNSDIISLHCPLNKDTYHLINAESINKMKDNVMIINTSRGQIIDTKALIEGLKNKKVGNAGLDVYEEENDYFFEDFSATVLEDDTLARLLSFTNVLVTSHQAFFTKEALHNIAETTLLNIKEYIEGKQLTNEICYKCNMLGSDCRRTKGLNCF